MAAIRLRSPRYRDSVCSDTHLSVQMTIKINNVMRYTIVKDSTAGFKNLFEYAELSRDYINIEWTGSYANFAPQSGLVIVTDIKYFAGVNGTGLEVTSGISGGGIVTQSGFDSYSNFVEGYNKDIANGLALISNYSETSGDVKTYTVYYPSGLVGRIPYLKSDGTQIIYQAFLANSTSITLANTTSTVINLKRYHCNKYEQIAISFINKYGALQREYFTLKNTQRITAKRENYNRNIVGTQGQYSINKHTIQNFNIEANEEMTVNSDYLPEYYNEVFTELLLSDYVWATLTSPSTNDLNQIPINITDSNLTYKTQVNDRLINFTFNFKMSYDYIQNVR